MMTHIINTWTLETYLSPGLEELLQGKVGLKEMSSSTQIVYDYSTLQSEVKLLPNNQKHA